MERRKPTVRLHLWLEDDDATIFGSGRVFLLDLIEEYGSLRKAARTLGMSYRAAWGKLHASEEMLGMKLIENSGNRRDGCHLTPEGRRLRDMFKLWFAMVEEIALEQADNIFPWNVRSYDGEASDAPPPAPAGGGIKGLPSREIVE